MWEALAVTDAFGRWSMALPEGRYDVRARAPWGDVAFGDGERVGRLQWMLEEVQPHCLLE